MERGVCNDVARRFFLSRRSTMRAWKVVVLVAVALAAGFALGIAEGELPFTRADIAKRGEAHRD
jgi:hypothetical protein